VYLKKGIVLLMTLMFITAISALILKNLDDSEQFFKVVDTDISLVQTKLLIDDTNREIMNFFKDNKNNMDTILENIPPSLPLYIIDDIIITINIEEYYPENYININDINSTEKSEDFIKYVDFKFRYFEILKKQLKEYKKITNQKQINNILDQYIMATKDDRILEFKDKLIYQKFNIDDNTSERFIKCSYDLDVKNISSSIDMIFEVGKNNFLSRDFYFRNKNE